MRTCSCREKLEKLLQGKTKNDNYRGEQRRAHEATEAERLWTEGLQLLQLKEKEILLSKSTRMEKQGLA